MRNFLSYLWEILKIVIIALVIVVPIRYFLFQPFLVKGASMEPNFSPGEYLIVDEISYRFSHPQRGEVIVFKNPQNSSQRFIKRIIGLPGETIEIREGEIIIFKNGARFILNESSYLPQFLETPGNLKTSLGENEYFVLGDNRFSSSDSRHWGALPQKEILGKVFLRLFPIFSLDIIKKPMYSNP